MPDTAPTPALPCQRYATRLRRLAEVYPNLRLLARNLTLGAWTCVLVSVVLAPFGPRPGIEVGQGVLALVVALLAVLAWVGLFWLVPWLHARAVAAKVAACAATPECPHRTPLTAVDALRFAALMSGLFQPKDGKNPYLPYVDRTATKEPQP